MISNNFSVPYSVDFLNISRAFSSPSWRNTWQKLPHQPESLFILMQINYQLISNGNFKLQISFSISEKLHPPDINIS